MAGPQGLRASPRGSGHPTAPHTCGGTCNTEPTSGPKASCLAKHLPIPAAPGRQQHCATFPSVCWFGCFYRKKLLLDPGVRVLATSCLSPPLPLHFLGFSAKALKSSRLLQHHIFHFKMLRFGCNIYIYKAICVYINAEIVYMCMARGLVQVPQPPPTCF